ECRNDEDSRKDEPSLDEPVRHRPRTGLSVDTGHLRGAINKPVSVAEARYRCCDKEWLIRREPRELPDPRAAHPKTEQDQRPDAAGRGGQGAEQATGRHQALPTSAADGATIFLDRHGRRVHPVVTTGSRTLAHAPNHDFASGWRADRRDVSPNG